jgi:hypothetical protein
MGDAPQPIILTQGNLDYVKEVKAALASAGVTTEILPAPRERQHGYETLYLLVAPAEMAEPAKAALTAWLDRDLDEDQRKSAHAVVDRNAEESHCPACMTPIPASAGRCPECDLNLHIEE